MELNNNKRRVELDEALIRSSDLLAVFFENKINLVLHKSQELRHDHFYYSMLYAYFNASKAATTGRFKLIEAALTSAEEGLKICDAHRKKRNIISRMLWSSNPNDYSDEEAHAECCYAACCSFVGGLGILTDRSLFGLIRVGLRLRGYQESISNCKMILESQKVWSSDLAKASFESLALLEYGGFELMLSHFPERVLRIVKFFGFPGDRKEGMRLMLTSAQNDGMWSSASGLILLGYQMQVEYIIGLGETDIKMVDELLEKFLEKHGPESGFFLMARGNCHVIKSNLDLALKDYLRTIECFKDWQELNDSCYWLLIWCYSLMEDYDSAARYAKKMVDDCNWSPATSIYQLACFRYMKYEETGDKEILEDVSALMRVAPKKVRKFVGLTVPFEKFIVKRCELYFKDDQRMVEPILELYLLWNIFPMIKSNQPLLKKMLSRLLDKVDKQSGVKNDSYYYLKFLSGICYHYLNQLEDALSSLHEVLTNESQVQLYSHLPPQTSLELGLIYKDLGKYTTSRRYLKKATSDYSKYINETIVHFRAHCALRDMRENFKIIQE